MKQRSFVVAAIAMMPLVAAMAQQSPPTPPAKPTPATPAEKPMVPAKPLIPLYPDYIDRDEIRRISDEARIQGQMAAEEGRRAAEEARRAMEDARWDMQYSMPNFKVSMPDMKISMPEFNFDFQMPKLSGQSFMTNVPFEGQKYFSGRAEIGPPPSFGMQGDPADSIYNLGREAFNRQDYSRAAARFADMIAKYPNSRQVSAAAYYQAFSLYRIGTTETLRSSLKVLEANAQRFDYDNSRQFRSDAPALQARVLRSLVDRNESGADAKLRDLVAKYPADRYPGVACDKEKIDIQREVLNSYYQTDPEGAMPYIRNYLNTRDACNAQLRESAIFLLANKGTEENANLIVQLAKNDTVRSVRRQAIDVLSRMPGDAAIAALQQFMNDPDDQISSAAVRSLMRNNNPKARTALRMTLIDKKDAPERQRAEAIRAMANDNLTPEEAVYLRNLFNRDDSETIKSAIVGTLGSVPTEDNLKFLLDVAQNQNESSTIRSSALRRVTSRQNITTENLIKLYDASDNRSMRNSLVDALAQRPEPAAVNKLLEIVKRSTDPEVQANAIRELLGKNDKAITQKVLDLIKPS